MKKVVREPIATWWKVNVHHVEIEPVRVVAFTARFVTYLQKSWRPSGPDVFEERRKVRDNIFPTFAEAKAEAVNRCTKGVECAKKELHRRRTELGMYESMTEPK